jgi:hypothetical protein
MAGDRSQSAINGSASSSRAGAIAATSAAAPIAIAAAAHIWRTICASEGLRRLI